MCRPEDYEHLDGGWPEPSVPVDPHSAPAICSPSAAKEAESAPDRAWLEARRVLLENANLDDLVGLTAAKRELRSLAARLANRQVVADAGANLPRGVLLWGPAGCGKTTLARVLATMLEAHSTFYELSAAELTAERLRALGDWLRQRPDNGPVVIYLDEVDLIARWRRDAQHTESTRAALFALLSLLDGLQPHDGAVFVAATNDEPSTMDPAITRAGRFGIHIAVDHPSLSEREELFRRLAQTRRVAEDLDWRRAAELSGTFASPADLIQCLDDGFALALADGGDRLDWAHLDEALQRFGQVTNRPRLEEAARTARAIHEAGHAVAAWLLGLPLRRLVLETPEGSGLTGTEEETPQPADEISARIAMQVSLAGRAAEMLLLEPDRYGLGSMADIDKATALAQQRADAGTLPGAPVIDRNLQPPSPRLADALAAAIEHAVASEQQAVTQLLREHLDALRAFAAVAEREGLMGGEEIRQALLGVGLPPQRACARRTTHAATKITWPSLT